MANRQRALTAKMNHEIQMAAMCTRRADPIAAAAHRSNANDIKSELARVRAERAAETLKGMAEVVW